MLNDHPTSTIEIGQRFGNLTIIGPAVHVNKNRLAYPCICICGTNLTRRKDRLLRTSRSYCGNVSCRPFRPRPPLKPKATKVYQRTPRTSRRRGIRKADHPLFATWSGMLDRCYNPNNASYRHYGGRGIRVCDAWRHSFQKFAQDMGPRPSAQHSIDRTDNDGIYEPNNCRWATKLEQVKNRRSRRIITTVDGEKVALSKVADANGLACGTLFYRLVKLKLPLREALARPVATSRPRGQTPRMLTAYGIEKPLAQWAREYGLSRKTLWHRLQKGYSPEESLTMHGQLTENQVREIREKFANGEGNQRIAKAFGVSSSTIRSIIKGRNWKRVH